MSNTMLFNSYTFLFAFLPVALSLFFILGHASSLLGAAWLGLASLFFYAWGSPLTHLCLLLGSILFNYTVGLAIGGSQGAAKRAVFTLGIVGNLALLGYFKYANFLIDAIGADIPLGAIVLPLGISFFTFTQIAYLVDVWRGHARERNIVHYLLFVTYFPHLIAGPILHHAEMMPQFAKRETYRVNWKNMALGASIFAIGIFKKCVIADGAAPYADRIFGAATTTDLTMLEAWFGALAYTVQIYFDFSAYSDMAIGISILFGIRLPLNFNSPYKAANIIDFWRRWHMTLSRFLRDYLYIPLGGNRHGKFRRHANLLATMALGGLWHGAGWTFLIWGALHGTYLIINHAWRSAGRSMPKLAGMTLTFIAVVFAWVFFRADTLDHALAFTRAMVDVSTLGTGIFPNFNFKDDAALYVVLPLVMAWALPNVHDMFGRWNAMLSQRPRHNIRWYTWRPSVGWALFSVTLLLTGILMMSGDSPFLYFRF